MGIKERRIREKNTRIEQIIDAAESVFSKGFQAATMDKIAEKAELSKGSLYSYFSSKNELCLSITLRALRIIRGYFSEILEKKIKAVDKIICLADSLADLKHEYPNYFSSLINYVHHSEECDPDSDIFKKSIDLNKDITTIIKEIINEGKRDGSINADLDSRKTAFSLWGNFSGIIPGSFIAVRNLINYSKQDQDEIFTNSIKIIQRSLKT